MTYRKHQRARLAAGILLTGLLGLSAQAQTSDALLNKLVEKGILSKQEADQLKKETDQEFKKDFSKEYQTKSGMPEWVTALKFNGDFRGRVEHFNADDPINQDRTRYRYRLRLGAIATIKDDFEVGLRLASGDQPGGYSTGNPVSANTTLQDNATRKGLYVDVAYGKWTPIHNDLWTASAMIGKMDNPFQISNMLFDYDYQPEGGALQGVFKINDHHALRGNAAVFILDELNQGVRANADPYLYGGQVIWEGKWTPAFDTALGVSVFDIANEFNLGNNAVPNVNTGNTRSTSNSNLVSNLNPIVGSASATYKFDGVPLYKGPFPVRIGGEFMKNPGAHTDNQGWWAGITLGKAGKKGLWDISYRYQRLEADAWWEELPDDDFTAYYSSSLAGSGFGRGIFGGTNIKGHLMKLNYSLTDSLMFSFTYYLNDLIKPVSAGANSTAAHFMADLNWKF